MVFEDLNIENLPAKLVLYVLLLVCIWIVPNALNITVSNISSTTLLIYKIIMTVAFIPIVHIIVDIQANR